jgi:hypothetical protein
VPAPVYTAYKGRKWSLFALQEELGISWNTLVRWRRHGGISALRIERFLRDRKERRRLLQLARESGVPDHVMRMRIYRGGDPDAAATTPVRPAQGGKRKVAANAGAAPA